MWGNWTHAIDTRFSFSLSPESLGARLHLAIHGSLHAFDHTFGTSLSMIIIYRGWAYLCSRVDLMCVLYILATSFTIYRSLTIDLLQIWPYLWVWPYYNMCNMLEHIFNFANFVSFGIPIHSITLLLQNDVSCMYGMLGILQFLYHSCRQLFL